MDKIEGLTYLITKQIRDRPQLEDFRKNEYVQLVKNIRDWCNKELKEKK